jgi:hypothetical protein
MRGQEKRRKAVKAEPEERPLPRKRVIRQRSKRSLREGVHVPPFGFLGEVT